MKNSTQRRRSLLQLLQAGQQITQAEAASQLEVDPRTIRRDIDFLRDIEKQPIEGTPTGYQLRKPSRAESHPTDDRLFGMLFLAGGFIDSRYSNLDSDIALQWKRCFLGRPEIYPEDLTEINQAVQLRHPITSEEMLQKIGIIGKSILTKTALTYRYRNLQSLEESPRHTFPLQLREQDGTWYLIAMCYHSMDRRIYALDRIENLSPTLENSPQPDGERITKWLDDDGLGIWLPSPEAEIQSVKIRVSGYALSHFQAHPIHATQIISEKTADHCLLTLKVRDLTGVMLLLRRFNPDVEVIEPANLRNQMIADLNSSLARYQAKE